MIGPVPECLKCKHFHADDEERLTCEAFPRGIPEPIYMTAVLHHKPYPGDHGIRFEPAEEPARR